MKFTAKVTEIDKKAAIVELFQGKTGDGKDFYTYIAVKPSKYEEYKKSQISGKSIDLTECGKILYVDWGKKPTEEVKQEMIDKYNLDTDFEEKFLNELDKIEKNKEE